MLKLFAQKFSLAKKKQSIFRSHKTKILIMVVLGLLVALGLKMTFTKPSKALADTLIKFDEGTGTSVADNQGAVVAGTISNATWKPEDLCYEGKCLFFDGGTDYVRYADDADLDFIAADNVTIEGWFRTSDISTGTRTLIAKYLNTSGTDGGYKVYMNSAGTVTFGIDNNQTSFPSDTATSTSAYDDNKWHHFAAVKNGTSSIKLYIDAELVGSDSSITSSTLANTDPLYIGIDGNASSNPWLGFIDEIKILRTARTAAEIKADMSGGTKNRGTSASFEGTTIGATQSLLSDGLTGYWPLEPILGGTASAGPYELDSVSSTTLNSTQSSQQIVRTSTGGIYTLTREEGTFVCQIYYSDDGTTWTEIDSGQNPSCGDYFAMAIDSTGKLHILYTDSSNSSILYSTMSGDLWSHINTAATTAGDSFEGVNVAIDSSDRPHIAYVDLNGFNYIMNYKVYDTGAWGSAVTLLSSTTTKTFPSIVISEDNIPEIAFLSDTTLYASVGNTTLATSFTNHQFESNAGGTTTASIGVDSSGNTWVAYVDENGVTDLVSLARHPDASAWASGWTTAITNNNTGNYPNLAINGTDIYLIYEDANADVAYDRYNGSDWLGEQILLTGTYSTTLPRYSFLNNPSYTSYGIDFLVQDDVATEIMWGTIGLGTISNLLDLSGNEFNLTNNATTPFEGGKFGAGSEHVPASSQYLSVASTINNIKTISFWVNPDSTSNYFISLTASAYITSTSGVLTATGITNPKIYVNGVHGAALSADAWQLVTVTTDTAINADQFYIGRQGSNYFDGTLDEIRLYTKKLEIKDIMSLYAWAPGPVGHWKLDDGNGTTALDSSSYGSNTTMSGSSLNSNSWKPGKFGGALNFGGDGTSDQLSVNDPSTGILDFSETQSFSVSAWAKIQVDNVENQAIVSKAGAPGWIMRTDETNQTMQFQIKDGTVTPFANTNVVVTDDSWHHFVGVRDVSTDTIKIYMDGVLHESITDTTTATIANSSPLRISWSSEEVRGLVDDVRVYSYALSPIQVAQTMNAGHPVPGSPVGSAIAHYKLDEGAGNIANNSGSQGNNVEGIFGTTTSAPTWTNEGKFGKAASFDGGDYIEVADDASLDITGDFTISTWFMRSGGVNGYIVSKTDVTNDGGYALLHGNLGEVYCRTVNGSGYNDSYTAAGYVTDDSTWHHLVAVKSGTGCRVYVDGTDRTTSFATHTTVTANSKAMRLGTQPSGGNYVTGKIDEVKIYNVAMSADEVKVEYNQGKAYVLGGGSTEATGGASNASIREYCPPGNTETNCANGNDPGPVGEWKLDESSGTSIVYDTSENENNGSMEDFATDDWTKGKKGSGLNFDSSDNRINLSSPTTLDNLPSNGGLSISMWIYPRSSGEGSAGRLIQKDDGGSAPNVGWRLTLDSSNRFVFRTGFDGSSTDLLVLTTNTYTANKWHHIAVSWDGSATATNLHIYINGEEAAYTTQTNGTGNYRSDAASSMYIGNGNTQATTFDGIIDDVRIYNYVRSVTQVKWDYNRGGPILYYKFDECTGDLVHNTAPTANGEDSSIDGIINPGSTDNTATGTCSSGNAAHIWNDGTTGKYNGSIGFDNTDDYINVASPSLPTSDFSYAFWAKAIGSSDTFISSSNSSDEDELRLRLDSTNTLEVVTNNVIRLNASTTIDDGNWHHIVVVRSGTTIYTYTDGQLDGTATDSSGVLDFDTCDLVIGAENSAGDVSASCTGNLTGFVDGQMDDVRIYDYPLNATQIKTIMSGGAAVRF